MNNISFNLSVGFGDFDALSSVILIVQRGCSAADYADSCYASCDILLSCQPVCKVQF